MRWLDDIPLGLVALAALLLGLAPFVPEPHLFEKLGMLASGTLARPVDMLDLAFHGALPVLFLIKVARIWLARRRRAVVEGGAVGAIR